MAFALTSGPPNDRFCQCCLAARLRVTCGAYAFAAATGHDCWVSQLGVLGCGRLGRSPRRGESNPIEIARDRPTRRIESQSPIDRGHERTPRYSGGHQRKGIPPTPHHSPHSPTPKWHHLPQQSPCLVAHMEARAAILSQPMAGCSGRIASSRSISGAP